MKWYPQFYKLTDPTRPDPTKLPGLSPSTTDLQYCFVVAAAAAAAASVTAAVTVTATVVLELVVVASVFRFFPSCSCGLDCGCRR